MTENELSCPLCQQQNKCQVNSSEPCWCFTQKVPAELIDQVQVPSPKRNKACICANCIEKFNRLAKSIQ